MSVTRLTNQEFKTTYRAENGLIYGVSYFYNYTADTGMIDRFNGDTPGSVEIEITGFNVPDREKISYPITSEIQFYLQKPWFNKQICDLIEDAHVGQ